MSEQLGVQEVKKDISGKEVLRLLNEGKSREEIAAYFGQTVAAMKIMVWSHPKLKNRKAKKQFAINLIDDMEEVATTQNEVVEEVSEQEVIDTDVQTETINDIVQEEVSEDVPVEQGAVSNGTW